MQSLRGTLRCSAVLQLTALQRTPRRRTVLSTKPEYGMYLGFGRDQDTRCSSNCA